MRRAKLGFQISVDSLQVKTSLKVVSEGRRFHDDHLAFECWLRYLEFDGRGEGLLLWMVWMRVNTVQYEGIR